jgi:dTDP-4-dehydrorhamnose reductase
VIVVTGVSGLLGASFAHSAQTRGWDVLGLYGRHPIKVPGTRCVQVDLTEGDSARRLLEGHRAEWIVHCAAATDVDWCQEHPRDARFINAEVSGSLAAIARESGAGFVYVSTDSVFDGRAGRYPEDALPAPLNEYARSKLAGETAVRRELAQTLVVRTNFYGWSAQPRMSLAEWVLSRLETGQRVPGFSDVVFTPMLTNDLSSVILDMMSLRLQGTYHVAGSELCSKYEFAIRLADVFSLDRRLVDATSVGGSSLRAPRPRDTSLNTGKVSRALGKTMPDLSSGMKRLRMLRDAGFLAELRKWRGD